MEKNNKNIISFDEFNNKKSNFKKTLKENVHNKGLGLNGNLDLYPKAPSKQILNGSNQTMDFLRIGKHIKTKNIDGFIDSIQNQNIFISDRLTGEIKKYTLKEVIKDLKKPKDSVPINTIKGFEGTPVWATKQKIYENIEDQFDIDDMETDDDDIESDNDWVGYDDTIDNMDDDLLNYDDNNDLDDISDNNDDDNFDKSYRRRLLYGTEDNPEGLPVKENMHHKKQNLIKENKWIGFINDSYDSKNKKLIRGTEDNPLPHPLRKKLKNRRLLK